LNLWSLLHSSILIITLSIIFIFRFSAAQLHTAGHDYELTTAAPPLPPSSSSSIAAPKGFEASEVPLSPAAELTHLTLDHVHMGVGGDDSWSPSVHAEYLVPPAVYSFSVSLMPFFNRGPTFDD
jgi:beta-galactosidase